MQLFTTISLAMDAILVLSKELDISAVYVLIMISATNVNLRMFTAIPCSRLEEMIKLLNLFNVPMVSHLRIPYRNLLIFQRVLFTESQLRKKSTIRLDLSRKTLVIDIKLKLVKSL